MKGRKPGLDTLRYRLAGKYTGSAPDCPTWLDPVARDEWNRVVPELQQSGILTPVDAIPLAAYCQAYSQWRAAEERVRKDGMMIGQRIHPLLKHSVALLAELRRIAAEFGFTPAARMKVATPPVQTEEQDAFDTFLGEK